MSNNRDKHIKVDINFNEFKRLKLFSDENSSNLDDSSSLASQLSQEIHNSNPSPYLLSGYRGVGKTTLMKKVEKELEKLSFEENKTRIFVYVSIPKYQDIALILRKISRALYMSLLEYEKKHEGFQFDEKIKSKVEMLYMKTFYEVTDSHKLINKLENQVTISSEYNLQKFLTSIVPPILVFLVSLSNFNMPQYLNIAFTLVSLIWLALAIKINYKHSNTTQKEKEDVIKRLYDNEIAEVELIEVFKQIHNDVNVVLVLDEIDKIEKDNEVSILINELKPLMLSEYVYTVLVTGQNLYYQYHLASSKDNAVISSLFSKVVHVPILDVYKFEEQISTIFESVERENKALVKYYLKSKILEANRIPRRLFSLIQQDIKWKENKAFITINNEHKYYLKWNSEVFDTITNIEDELKNEFEYSDGIIDFLLNQLYNWVKKIISSGTDFTKELILNNTIEEEHPLKEFNVLEEYLDNLLIKLIQSKKIIEVKSNTDEVKYQVKYNRELLKGMKGKSSSFENEHNINYLEIIYSLRDLINKIYLNISGKVDSDENISIEDKLISIASLNTIDTSLNYNLNNLQSFGLVPNILSLLEDNFESSTNQKNKGNINSATLYKMRLLEEYVFYLVKNYLPNEFEVTLSSNIRNNRGVINNIPDIIATDNESTYLFEIKLTKNKRSAKSILRNSLRDVEKIMELDSVDENHKMLGILIFVEEDILDIEEEMQILRNYNNQLKQYENRLNVKLISDFSSEQIRRFLNELSVNRKIKQRK